MSQIYPQDRGQNYSIEMGERVAGLAMEDAAQAPTTVSANAEQ